MKVPVLLAILLTISLFAQSPDPLREGLRLLEEGRTTLDEASLNTAKDYFSRLTQRDPANAVYWYELAHTNRYLIESYSNRNDKKDAEQALDAALDAVGHSLTLNDKSADAHSLLADLYGRKISIGAFFAGPRFGPKVADENKRALALDADNPRVHASLGRQYLMAPGMFGGDVTKAIDELRKATQLDPNFDEAYVWLAIACRKHEDKTCADKAMQDALRINPRSAFARHFAAQK